MFENKAGIAMSVVAASVMLSANVGYAAEKGIVTADSLNIRSGPSTSYSIKAKAKKGTIVSLETKSNGWYKVSLANGISGWASASYIDVVTSSATKQGEILEATYLRKEAKWTTDKLELLKKGVKVEVISVDTNWTKVKYNNKTGYIANDYIKVVSLQNNNNSSSEQTSKKESGQILGATYLRKEAKWTTDKLILLDKGVKVEVVSVGSSWTKVKYNNKTGYVSNDYIKVVSTSKEPEREIQSGKVLGATYLRDVNSWSGKKLALLNTDTVVEVVSKDSNWTKVKYKNFTGYVANNYIEVSKLDNPSTNKDEKVKAVVNLAKAQLGKPYEWGSEGPNSFDCSGLIYYIYKNGADITLPRTSKEQAKVGKSVSYNKIKAGDLVSFDFDKDGVVSHIGVYVGDGEFIHALKPGSYVKTTLISSDYWKNAIYGIRRVIE